MGQDRAKQLMIHSDKPQIGQWNPIVSDRNIATWYLSDY